MEQCRLWRCQRADHDEQHPHPGEREHRLLPASRGQFRQCQWDAVAPVGFRVQLQVERMWVAEIPTQSDCLDESASNGLQVFSTRPQMGNDGLPAYSVYCRRVAESADRQANFTAPSSEFSFLFSLNTTLSPPPSSKGVVFSATVVFIAAVPGEKRAEQGHIVRLARGTSTDIMSQNYPKVYPRRAEAIWQFEVPEGYSVGYNLRNYHSGSRYSGEADGEAQALNVSCGWTMSYLRGYLAFVEGAYDRLLVAYGFNPNARGEGKVVKKICTDVESSRFFRIPGNVSSFAFHAPYHETPERQANDTRHLGFSMRVSAVCGGKLVAGPVRKSVSLERLVSDEDGTCEWAIVRDPKDEGESEAIYLRIEQINAGIVNVSETGDVKPAKFDVSCPGIRAEDVEESKGV